MIFQFENQGGQSNKSKEKDFEVKREEIDSESVGCEETMDASSAQEINGRYAEKCTTPPPQV